MKLCKIIIGLSAIGLASSALALVGDSGQVNIDNTQINTAIEQLDNANPQQLGATLKDTAAATFRVCNYNEAKSVTWRATTDGSVKAVLNNGDVTVKPNVCQTITLRGPYQSQGLLTIPAITLTATLDGSSQTAVIKISSIVQLDAKITKRLTVSNFTAASDNKLTVYDDFSGTMTEHPVAVTQTGQYEQNSSPVGADYTFCAGSNGKQCYDTNNMQ
jgi:hypothetical protein